MLAALPTIDLTVIALYLAVMLAIGFWFSKQTSAREFTVASGKLPGWVVGLSIFGTYISSISFLANPGSSYSGNWNGFVFSLSLPIAALIATRFFVPFYRQHGHISAYQHLEDRFGAWARYYAGGCYLLTQISRMATILYLVALAVAPLTGWDIRLIILGTGVLVTMYTLLGGIEAVIWTDAVQSVVLTLGIIAGLATVFLQLPEGPSQVLESAWQQGKFSLGSFSSSLNQKTFWVVLIYGMFINLQNFGIDQSYVQRYITAADVQAAKRSVWVGAWLYVPVSAMLFMMGTALFVFYQQFPDRLNGKTGDEVFPHFIVHELPVGVTGLLIASILAAAMSSVDSSLNSSATLIHEDWWKRLLKREPSERQSMLVLQGATLGFGVIGAVAALAMIGQKGVLDLWWGLASIFSGGMLGLFLLGMISRVADRRAAIPATILGVIAIAWLAISKTPLWPEGLVGLKNPLDGNLTIVVGTSLILVVGFLLGIAIRKSPE